jgi:hypothetical protein
MPRRSWSNQQIVPVHVAVIGNQNQNRPWHGTCHHFCCGFSSLSYPQASGMFLFCRVRRGAHIMSKKNVGRYSSHMMVVTRRQATLLAFVQHQVVFREQRILSKGGTTFFF